MSRGRVLCLTSNFPRWEGDSTTPFVLHLVSDLQRLGWSIDVLAPHAPGCARDEVLDGVRVARFRYLRPESMQTVCYDGGALGNLRKSRSNYAKLPALVLAETAAVVNRLRRGEYDLLHSHWILPQGFAGGVASAVTGVPQVVTVHGGDIFALRGAGMNALKRFALRRSAAVTVNSSATERAVSALDGRLPPLRRIPMGVDDAPAGSSTARMAELRARHRRGDGPLLVFVGRVIEEKGVGDVIQAVGLLAHELPDVSALVIGDGQDRADLEAESKAAGLDHRIEFTGWVDPVDVPNYLGAADVFVGPSRTSRLGWKEAQGLTFLEAMVAGTPVVATRSGGITDSVIDGQTGLLVDEGAPEQIARAVARLQARPELAKRLADAAQEQINQRFSRRASASAFDGLFGSVIEQQTGKRAVDS